jgi:hypothetical protein
MPKLFGIIALNTSFAEAWVYLASTIIILIEENILSFKNIFVPTLPKIHKLIIE